MVKRKFGKLLKSLEILCPRLSEKFSFAFMSLLRRIKMIIAIIIITTTKHTNAQKDKKKSKE